MIRVKRIDHVAIAVADADEAGGRLEGLFALEPGARETVADQGTQVLFLHPPGASRDDTTVELICPTDNQPLQRFLDRRGPGLHHICFEVDDLAAALSDLKAAGVALVDEAPRTGARGHQVAFLHPRATGGVLFELCQKGRTDL